ncbi:tRNA 2-selenouridine(34) synthase MnmH [Pusillimonas sp. ANT_WB101]|uniref:tRNA 2-selenouridine(34) synthase MnmH n=1 Tax=Pusillimonas sp. ANT_WB101 TaxID=2597356 RepID=UPI0011EFBA16|nr:tRNA 2-selenouridine(34) synthase MnmH [Pusillimonas sp. ANT_WB101]KAA0910492.1 tRNA 2-selenouridine(34) synthase MnmH [Pusillimonas sp. ANT_WB101]
MDNTTNCYRDLFLADTPMADLRAPAEYLKGAFPHTINLPLMDDEERHLVGTCYKQQGQEAAIALGHRLVSGAKRDERIHAWQRFARQHPNGMLYCFRGGLRSRIAQQWLAESGVDYPRVEGGYKALRGFLVETNEAAAAECSFILVGGLTGSGKTELLYRLDHAIDLEGHAHHRGSSFGKHATPQPAQIDFENRLAIDFLKKRAQGFDEFVLEEESRTVGRCFVPPSLHAGMQNYPRVWLEDTLENRINRILRDYVIDLAAEFTARDGEEAGFEAFAEQLRQSLLKIVKRLGHERYERLAAIMDDALVRQQRDGDLDLHREWISALLLEYYDPMYAYQRNTKADRTVFSGSHEEVVEYLLARAQRRRG